MCYTELQDRYLFQPLDMLFRNAAVLPHAKTPDGSEGCTVCGIGGYDAGIKL